MRAKLILAVAVGAIPALLGAPPAGATITVTQTGPAGAVEQGATVTYQATVANSAGAPTEPDLRTHVALSRPTSDAPVDDQYLTFSTSQGSCQMQAKAVECQLGALAGGATVQLSATIEANQSFAQKVTAYRCTAPPACDFTTELGTSVETTQVNYPPELSGSKKISIKGLPPGCADASFKVKAKAKAKRVSRMYGYLSGPTTEFGTTLPTGQVHGRIAKSTGSKLKLKLKADKLDPGFYELKLTAKPKHGKTLTRKASFQVCGPTAGF